MTRDLILRDAEIDGRGGLDVRVRNGMISEIGVGLCGPGPRLDAQGGALIPGLADHHLHLFAMAAAAASLRLGPDLIGDCAHFARTLRAADARAPAGVWLRGIDYHERVAGPLTRDALDRLAPNRPVRVQYATGSLWVLNSAALRQVLGADTAPPCVERDESGQLSGRVWRGDSWLRARLAPAAPDLGDVSAALLRAGVTAVCDASASTDSGAARSVAEAVRTGALAQRVMLMSADDIAQAADSAYRIGPVKIMLDDDAIDLDDLIARIALARAWRRNVAFHCVTALQLAVALAALETAGCAPGDRIEHGGVICAQSAARLAQMNLTVVTQPCFISERGDRYLDEAAAVDVDALYPCASLLAAGVKVAGSTDAPYTRGDVWAAMAAAATRRTRAERVVNARETVSGARALRLFLGPLADPGGPARRVGVGATADLCLLDRPLHDALAAPSADHVAATLIGGRVCWARDACEVDFTTQKQERTGA